MVLSEKSLTGASAWSRLYDEQHTAIEVTIDDEAFTRVFGPDVARPS